MYEINRSILIIRPKQPYADWANNCDDGLKITLEELREDSTAYLIPEVESKEDEERVLRKRFPGHLRVRAVRLDDRRRDLAEEAEPWKRSKSGLR